MGLCISRLHFEKGLPSVKQIKGQFKKQTGLDIWIKAYVTLLELPLSNKDVVEKLNQDISKYEEFRKKKFDYNWEEIRKESQKINYISNFQFYNIQFYGIDFHIEGKTIEMEYEVDCYYFTTSLNKTLFDLGGRFVTQENAPTKGWESPKSWKKLKYWDDYKWYNRPRK